MSSEVRKFVRLLFLFIIPILVGVGYIEFRLNCLENTYTRKNQIIRKLASSIEVLVVGSSHALHGIDPTYFDSKAINLANTSQSIFYDSQLATRYLGKMEKLKVVVFPISYFSLGYDLMGEAEEWRCYYYWRFMGIRAPNLPWDSKLFSAISLYSWPQVRKYLETNFSTPLVNGMNDLGWQKPELAKSLAKDQYGQHRVDFHNKIMHNKNFVINEKYLSEALAKLNRAGIKVLFVRMPVSENYYRYTNPKIFERNEEIIIRLCKPYGCQFFNGQALGYPQDLFADDDHLSTEGARRFSLLLNSQINQMKDQ